MSGIRNDGPKSPAVSLIDELKQKQSAKMQPKVAPPPAAKKAPVMPPVQEGKLTSTPVKRALPKQPVKQAVKRPEPVPVVKAAPKPMTGAVLKAQLARELIGVEYSQLPLEIQAIVTRNVKNPDNLINEFDQFISSFVSKIVLEVMKEAKRFEGGVFHYKAPEEFTDKASNMSFEEKAMKFVDAKSLNLSKILEGEFFDGGKESVAFRKFSFLFMKSMLPENFPLVRDMGEQQQMANGQMPFLLMFTIGNMANFSERIQEADVNQVHMRYDVEYLGVPGNYLTMVPPIIARLKKLETLDIGYEGTAFYVPDILLPETMLKLEKLREVYFHGMKPVDGDDNEVVKALRARGCQVVFGDTYNQ